MPEEELLALCPEIEVPAGIPDTIKKTMRRKKALEFSRDYFEANIWASIEQKILGVVREPVNQEDIALTSE